MSLFNFTETANAEITKAKLLKVRKQKPQCAGPKEKLYLAANTQNVAMRQIINRAWPD